jgi:anti-sigma regulatory factor (Ser/Thr protein kinase)
VPTTTTYEHDALFYEDVEDMARSAASFLREGLDRGESAVLVARETTTLLVAEELGRSGTAGRLTTLPRDDFCRHDRGDAEPYRALLDHLPTGAPRTRLFGEVAAGHTPGAWREWTELEAMRSAAFAGLPLWCVCGYDRTALPDEVVTAGELTHAYVRRGVSRLPNPSYVAPGSLLRRVTAVDADPVEATEPVLRLPGLGNLREARAQVRAITEATKETPDVVDSVVLVVSELASNAVRHGGHPASLSLWVTPTRFVCAVSDAGEGFHEELEGHEPPEPLELPEGRLGLWLVRQLADRVSTTRHREGFTVRVSMTYDPDAGGGSC